jgi:hypothetical protein
MRKRLTKKFLLDHDACEAGIEVFVNQPERDTLRVLRLLLTCNVFWTEWLIARLMTRRQQAEYAAYILKCMLPGYRRMCPGDTRLREIAEAVQQYAAAPSARTLRAVRRSREVAIDIDVGSSYTWRVGRTAVAAIETALDTDPDSRADSADEMAYHASMAMARDTCKPRRETAETLARRGIRILARDAKKAQKRKVKK